jgi:hypothetical protein
MHRPETNDYPAYYNQYVSTVGEGNIIELMESQLNDFNQFFSKIDEEKSHYRYAEGKWSINEIVGHLLEAERFFACRALRFSRNDATPVSGFEENYYVENSNYDEIALPKLVEELSLVRRSNILMFRNFTTEMWKLKGTANNKEFTVLSIPFIIVGHLSHHLEIIKERYLN